MILDLGLSPPDISAELTVEMIIRTQYDCF